MEHIHAISILIKKTKQDIQASQETSLKSPSSENLTKKNDSPDFLKLIFVGNTVALQCYVHFYYIAK